MTGRERVLATLDRKKVDRVPRLLYDETIGYVPAIAALLEEKCFPLTPRDYFRMDITGVKPNPTRISQNRFKPFYGEKSAEAFKNGDVDEWGVWWKKGNYYHYAHIQSPLRLCASLSEVQSYPLPDLDEPYRVEGLRERIDRLHEDGFAVASFVGSVFEQSWYLRGLDQLMIDMTIDPEIAHYLFDVTSYFQRKLAEAFTTCGVDIIMTGDDVATQGGLMMSPQMWKTFLQPRLAETVRTLKRINPSVKVFYHSCGNVKELIQELINTGIDILNPVQPDCMNPAEIYRTYGRSLILWGTISVQKTMTLGSPEDVSREVRQRLTMLGENGGLILSPAHVLSPETPWKNIEAFFKAVDTHICKYLIPGRL
jgi:uroporphyrinogen decarboxylase